MKIALTMADIGNAIEAASCAIEFCATDLDSTMPPRPRNKKARLQWSEEDRAIYDELTDQLRRFRTLKKKLLAIEKAA